MVDFSYEVLNRRNENVNLCVEIQMGFSKHLQSFSSNS